MSLPQTPFELVLPKQSDKQRTGNCISKNVEPIDVRNGMMCSRLTVEHIRLGLWVAEVGSIVLRLRSAKVGPVILCGLGGRGLGIRLCELGIIRWFGSFRYTEVDPPGVTLFRRLFMVSFGSFIGTLGEGSPVKQQSESDHVWKSFKKKKHYGRKLGQTSNERKLGPSISSQMNSMNNWMSYYDSRHFHYNYTFWMVRHRL